MIKGRGHSFSLDWWAIGILLYEMKFGRHPFRILKPKGGSNLTFKICNKKIIFPSAKKIVTFINIHI